MIEHEIYLPDVVGKGYGRYWNFKGRYRVCKGSRASKKSTTTAMNMIYRLMAYPLSNGLVVRKTYRTLKDSCFSQLKWAIRRLGVSRYWRATLQPLELTYLPTGQKILLRGLDDPLKVTSVTVFYNFQHDRDRLLEALKKSSRRVRVLSSAKDQADWNARKIDVLLTHPAASAYGLNLQEGGHHVIWFGLTWNYELYTQANKRLHRQGQDARVMVHHLVSQGTRDEDVMAALEKKEDVQAFVLDSLKARLRRVQCSVSKGAVN